MKTGNITYRVGPASGKARLLKLLAFYAFFGGLGFFLAVSPDFFDADTLPKKFILRGAVLSLFVGSAFAIRANIFEFKWAHIRVELTDKFLVAYDFRERRSEINWTEIVAIKPTEKLFFAGQHVHLKLVLERGGQLVLHHNLEPLDQCMHAIESRSPNLRSIDYGGLENTDLWTGKNKL